MNRNWECEASPKAARAQVRRRGMSLHTMTEDGTKANDSFLTIVETAKKLGVSAYDYIYDRVSKRFLLTNACGTDQSEGVLEMDFDTG